MAWTTPITFVAGAILTAAQQNVNVRDNTNALYDATRRLSRTTRTTPYEYSSSTVGGATNLFATSLSWTADGTSAYRIEFFCGRVLNGGTAYSEFHLVTNSGTDLANMSVLLTTGIQTPISLIYYYTPSAGAVTANFRGITPGGGGTCTMDAGTGDAGLLVPIFMNVYGPEIT